MNTVQVILIALFCYLGAIGSIVGNTIGWYCLGRPLVASFVVGLIMGDVNTAMVVGVPLQIAYLANVTPGGAVEVCVILGKDETLRRLRLGIERLS